MCGVVALWRPRGPSIVTEQLEQLGAALDHRGPDERGHAILDRGRLGLIATRLAIVDPSAGPQPYFNEDRSVAVVVNGELYDHLELGDELRGRGHQLRTRCDAELIAHLYEERGLEFVDELDGDFAVIVWDARRERLIAARDRVGVRPLFVLEGPDRSVALASEAKALLPLVDEPRLRARFLSGHFLGAYSGSACAFEGVESLAPATVHSWELGQRRRRVFWRWLAGPGARPSQARSRRQPPEPQDLREQLERAVSRRLRADAPIGLLFSGGLDSALVAALARRERDLPAFTLAFDDPSHDESALAQAHARSLDLELDLVRVGSEELAAALPQTIRALEFPPVNAHAVARYLLARHVRERGVKVVLSGEGSDELFAGYPWFMTEARWRARAVDRAAAPDPAAPAKLGVGLLDDALDRDPASPLWWASFFDQRARRVDAVPSQVFLPRWRGEPSPSTQVLAPLAGLEAEPALDLSRLLALHQLSSYLIPALSDRVEMAHGVEGRPVFLDRAILDLAARAGETELLDLASGQGKLLLRRAGAGLLPPEICAVPKHPFLAPSWRYVLASATGRALLSRYLEREAIAEFGVFDPNVLSFVRHRWERLSPAVAAGHRHDWLIGLALGLHIFIEQFRLR
ncbi:Asparagine synthetase 2 [Enhygromyxa salina]|uniref:asparagine synthase (glutamine-hydrolyzing) n=1 Tax=Enhygromyxa salina TaxID=215803 RepID=A0A2S9YL40_9BACT|nr:asparagine synthase (glutamine-hydrolyzing) [Enhygromyxa salina]PRQ05830.1 Asparagine synthetase 2 [Enhygromyxa salina]